MNNDIKQTKTITIYPKNRFWSYNDELLGDIFEWCLKSQVDLDSQLGQISLKFESKETFDIFQLMFSDKITMYVTKETIGCDYD